MKGALVAVSLLAALAPHSAPAQSRSPNATAPSALIGTWRISRVVSAPWESPSTKTVSHALIGRTVTFTANAVVGPTAFACSGTRYSATRLPAEGLFQGNLPKPAADAAHSVGVSSLPVPGVSLACDRGLFEYHFTDATTALVALDNAIYALDRSAGALADAGAPPGVVQRLMESHFAGSMGFEPRTVADKRHWLTDALVQRISRYFAKPVPEGEVPDINGDPFTDSQETPTRFSVRAATMRGDRATVPVHFVDWSRTRTITYVLERSRGVWRVSDVEYGRAPSLWVMLR